MESTAECFLFLDCRVLSGGGNTSGVESAAAFSVYITAAVCESGICYNRGKTLLPQHVPGLSHFSILNL